MHIVCIQLIIIINHLSFSLLVETKSYTNMCFSNESIVGKSPPFTPDSTKLTIGELEDNCDYIDIEDRIKLNCDNKSLSLIQLNIRGLLSKSSALNLLLSENVGNIRPDLVLLCETWLNSNNNNNNNNNIFYSTIIHMSCFVWVLLFWHQFRKFSVQWSNRNYPETLLVCLLCSG